MDLTIHEELLVKKDRWEKMVKEAKIKHSTHDLAQSGECCMILMNEETE